jgi:tetratricopeptide (TPR) repeat protein
MSWERWLRALRARLDAYESTGDAELVLAREASEEAVQLVVSLPSGPASRHAGVAASWAAGWLHWYAHRESRERNDHVRAEIELDAALSHWLNVYRADPSAVPGEIADLFARTAHVGRDPRGALIDALGVVVAAAQAQESGAALAIFIGPLGDAIDILQRVAVDGAEELANMASQELGSLLMLRWNATGDDTDLERAVARLRLNLREPRDAKPVRLLGYALYQRGHHRDDVADLDEAIALLERAVSATPTALLANDAQSLLADARYARYLLDGDPTTLAGAIATKRAAVDGAPGAGGVSQLAALSTMLTVRYQATGDTESLDEAIVTARQAVTLAAGALRSSVSATLGRALMIGYQRHGRVSMLLDAIDLFRDQLAGAPPEGAGGPTRPNLYMASPGEVAADLGAALLIYHRLESKRRGGKTDLAVLDEAIAMLRRATGDGALRRDDALTNLGVALAERWTITGDSALIEEVIAVYRTVVAAATTTASRAHARHNLASALAERARAQGVAVPAEAIDLARTVAREAQSAPLDRLADAQRWAEWAASVGDRDEAVAGYRMAVGLLPDLVPRPLRRSDQQRLLSGRFTMVGDAAATALDAGRPATALELLEHGRGVLVPAAAELDRHLADLRAAAPGLADDLQQVRRALAATTADGRHALHARERQLLAEVRRLPGFERFGCPPDMAQLHAAAELGPVVTVNVSAIRCDAIVLHGRDVVVVPLPGLRADELTTRADEFDRALVRAEHAAVSLVDRLAAQETIQRMLEYLWDAVAGPVLDCLAHLTPPSTGQPLPRVWWSPTGPLTALPLHAAGYHDGGPTVLDRVVSSYTPTIRALARLRAAPDRANADGAPLVVAMPDTPGHAALPATLAEAEALAAEYGVTALVGPRAIRRRVLDALSACRWVHFACHAHADNADPSGSHLILYDQPLTVTDLLRTRVPRAHLAYLSACSTARTSAALAGEAIHAGAAFQIAGFRHVVATLWQVEDRTAAALARAFYASRETAGIAHALHFATRSARDCAPRLPSRWAAHIHLGP